MNRLLTVGATCAALLAAPASGQATIDVTMFSGQPPVFLWVKHMRESFAPAADAALTGTDHCVNWAEAFGTLASTGGEMKAVEDGLAEFALVTTVMQPTLLLLQNVTYYTRSARPIPGWSRASWMSFIKPCQAYGSRGKDTGSSILAAVLRWRITS
jgi:hypothetical protein